MKQIERLMSQIRVNIKTNPIIEEADKILIKLNSNSLATILFKKLDGNTYDLIHTEIPEKFQSKGLGRILAERVFDHLINKGIQLKLTCEFLQHFYKNNSVKYRGHILENPAGKY